MDSRWQIASRMTKSSETKPAIQCVSIWGNLIAVAGGALPLVAVELANLAPSRYIRLTAVCVTAIGAVLSSYGRVVDRKKISGVFRG